jgi:L-alanine-DL-glutamate epimerase-like enolase superfamily enzyme
MKIISLETIVVGIPYEIGGGPRMIAGRPATTLDVLLVRVETEDGLVGWGEAFGHAVVPATQRVLETLIAPLLVGRDATDIAGVMHALSQQLHLFGRNGPVVYALSGVDIALWDLAGKRAGLPLYQMLGGRRCDSVTTYASLLRYGDPAAVARNCAEAVRRGYKYIKLHEITEPCVCAARETIGPDIALMVDTNCPWTVAEAKVMADTLRPYNLYWLEEPVWPPEDHAGLAEVRARGVPTSAGENAGGLHDFRHLFEAAALDIAQPSVTKIGGITEMRKIIALAEAFGVRAVPHCAYFGPGFLASLHINVAMPRETPLERLYMDLEASLFAPYTEPVDGMVPVPHGPGLGCDPDPDVLARYRTA